MTDSGKHSEKADDNRAGDHLTLVPMAKVCYSGRWVLSENPGNTQESGRLDAPCGLPAGGKRVKSFSSSPANPSTHVKFSSVGWVVMLLSLPRHSCPIWFQP